LKTKERFYSTTNTKLLNLFSEVNLKTLLAIFAAMLLATACGKQTKTVTVKGIDGKDGANGQDGSDGQDGQDGADGANARKPGLSCNLHDLKSWDGKSSLPEILKNNPVIGNFVLPNLSVPDSQAVNGFPGMPKELQDIVGIDGYALDCYGYLNIETSGSHTIKLLSDDGSRLSIEDSFFFIDNQGLHAPQTVSKTGHLNRGENKINVVYYQGPVTQIALELKMSGPNLVESVIPASAFTH
jgi:PA14 domain